MISVLVAALLHMNACEVSRVSAGVAALQENGALKTPSPARTNASGTQTAAPAQKGGVAVPVPRFHFDRPAQRVKFRDADIDLAGALLEPEGPGPFPAVVFVHGAGRATHDEPAFVVHANAFLNAGFAVLTYDKRGSGESTGNLELADYEDLARDVASAVRLLRSRREISPGKIGLMGRSEGGWVATLAASHDPSIAFVIMSSGSGVRPYEENLYWTRGALRAKGISPERVEQAVTLKVSIWSFYRTVAHGGTDPASLRRIRESLLRRLSEFADMHPELPANVMDPEMGDRRRFGAFIRMIDYDPAPAFAAVRAPMIEVIGDHDEVVEPSSTTAVFERLRASGRDVTLLTLPNVGHSLLLMEGERILGYPDAYLETIVKWARDRVARGPVRALGD